MTAKSAQNDPNLCWYHGTISRTEAEDILFEEAQDGSFLVRDSNSAAGDFVLSVFANNEVVHYQIRKYGDDAFFSIDEQNISHGLETLIESYREKGDGLIAKLLYPIKKDPPPHESRKHGRTNLLHRATREGNHTVVIELLKCGYRSIEAKNQEGQTAVHVASQLNKDDILQTLIEHHANCNCRDKEGYTPLHYACMRNSPSTVRILVEKGDANVQLRNPETGSVPLHEAASRGHLECVKVLLSLNSPVRPRTILNETPIDLAKKNGHVECANVLSQHTSSCADSNKADWYHGTLDRMGAVRILKDCESPQDGSFLVRFSDKNGYVLSMYFSDQVYHFQIKTTELYYFIDDGPYLDSLEHLIHHYRTLADGLPTKLVKPIPPTPNPPLPVTPHPATLPRVPFSTFPRSFVRNTNVTTSAKFPAQNTLSELFSLEGEDMVAVSKESEGPIYVNDDDMMITPLSMEDENYIPRENVILQEIIGEGEFGFVYNGILQHRDGSEEEVAIKTLKQELEDSSRHSFFEEARTMMKLRHNCIVRFIGLCTVPVVLMVQELVPLGSMLQYLLDNANILQSGYELKIWAWQIACGMRYLEEERFVHRDLASRNILLATRYQAKISDFGLSRNLSTDREYYRATQGGRWPIKWYAPESFNYGTFSSASDVWSFGITLWEMFSFGQPPYGDLKGIEVTDMIEKGERLKRPAKCSHETYQIMEQCWSYNPRNRPTFAELVSIFSSCSEYSNIKELQAHMQL